MPKSAVLDYWVASCASLRFGFYQNLRYDALFARRISHQRCSFPPKIRCLGLLAAHLFSLRYFLLSKKPLRQELRLDGVTLRYSLAKIRKKKEAFPSLLYKSRKVSYYGLKIICPFGLSFEELCLLCQKYGSLLQYFFGLRLALRIVLSYRRSMIRELRL